MNNTNDEEITISDAELFDGWEDNSVNPTIVDGDTDEEVEVEETEQTSEETETETETEVDGTDDNIETDTTEKQTSDQKFTCKYMGEEIEVGEDRVPELLQKGLDYDRIKEKYNGLKKFSGRDAQLEFLDRMAQKAGCSVDDIILEWDASQMQADEAAKGKEISLDEAKVMILKQKKAAPAPKAEETVEKTDKVNDAEKRKADFAKFKSEYPDVDAKSIPQEVWNDYRDGKGSLEYLYSRYEVKRVREENEIIKQNKKNSSRSFGSAKSSGTKTVDPIFDGWDDNKY